jgi:hypothetical protein
MFMYFVNQIFSNKLDLFEATHFIIKQLFTFLKQVVPLDPVLRLCVLFLQTFDPLSNV